MNPYWSEDSGGREPPNRPDQNEDLASIQTAKLVVREPGMDEVAVPLTRAVTVLGRDRSCDTLLHAPYVSRIHAQIERKDGVHVLTDLSTNGTIVNGQRIQAPVELRHGDEIMFSNVRAWYVIEIPSDAATPAMPAVSERREAQSTLLLSVDANRYSVWIEPLKAEVALTPLEFRLMDYLFQKNGNVATREEICEAVWGDSEYELDSLYRLVDRLKAKVEPAPAQPRFLISHRGIGYSLQAQSNGDLDQD